MKEKIAIIGAGPAGIIAAGYAASRGKDVYLIEKNEKLGKKLFITGKGRCNITNASPIDEFFDFIPTNNTFLYSSLYSFTNENIIDLLSKYGVEIKVERGNRVFPKSDKSSDVIKSLERFLKDNGVNIILNTKINDIKHEKNKFLLYTEKEVLTFDKLILATGGMSYPKTGSTGEGILYAKKLGHTIVPLTPALVPIEIESNFTKDLQGLSLKNVVLKAYYENRILHSEFGEMIFTHFGISGPIVLSTSNYLKKIDINKLNLTLDLKPALDEEKLNNRILRDFEKYINKQIKNALEDLLPQKLIIPILNISDIKEDSKVNQITKEQRQCLIKNIKYFPLKFKGFRPIDEAIITSGGIDTLEINPSTMESKLIENLYFVGEMIDVDALTGGYNLQIAYSTGYLAGINI